jgi:hypothetical protein
MAAEAETVAAVQHLEWSEYPEIDVRAPSVDSNLALRPLGE